MTHRFAPIKPNLLNSRGCLKNSWTIFQRVGERFTSRVSIFNRSAIAMYLSVSTFVRSWSSGSDDLDSSVMASQNRSSSSRSARALSSIGLVNRNPSTHGNHNICRQYHNRTGGTRCLATPLADDLERA